MPESIPAKERNLWEKCLENILFRTFAVTEVLNKQTQSDWKYQHYNVSS